jgi:hypothetical protein
VTESPGLALRASTGFDSVAFISELPAALACVCWVLADAEEALLLAALAPLRFALTAVLDVAEASPCGGAPSANAFALVANSAQHNVIELFEIKLFMIKTPFCLGGAAP